MNALVHEVRKYCSQPARQTDRGYEKEVLFPETFLGFQGHFPGRPVLPAVVQIMLFRENIATHLNKDLEITKITRSKFLKVISSDMPFTTIWTTKQTEDGYVCKCFLESNGEQLSNFTITLHPLT